ncbi:hypothetical protein F4T80_08805 [Acinetobacter pittii]|uniref:hypothetical protein n=1 Tax=Acinetobacter pittii TaxID=48296 RepID=UPI00129860CB|nr:hypothetical protein [Acinetobacter pittii]MRA18550.1 hypothetical protein [Acinetobacter pittii]
MLNPHLSTLLAQLKLHGFTQSLDSNIDAVYSGEINFEEAMIDACKTGYTDLMVDGAPLPHQPDTIIRWLIDRLRS